MAMLVLTVGLVYSGWVTFQFFPSIESDIVSASVTMPQGTPPERTSEILGRLEDGVEDVRRALIDETGVDHVRHFFTAIGNQPTAAQVGSGNSRPLVTAAHIGEIMIELEPAETRVVTSEVLGNRWRETTGPIPEATGVNFRTSAMDAGDDIDVQLVGPHIDELRAAAADLKQQLRRFPAVYGIRDTFEEGKPEVQLAIKPAAETLGLSLQDLGRQVRQAFYGEEAQRIQRDRDDIRVMVRYPAAQRRSLGDLENMRIRTPAGTEVPFSQVATVTSGRSLATIDRVDRRRAVNVIANVDDVSASSTEIIAALQDSVLPVVLARYPGVSATLEGVQAERRDSVYGLQIGFSVTLLVIFSLLAIPLKSYVQPLIIMSAIPFGLIGAVWGHVLLGYNVSLMSMFGLVALSGVVVNDSLIMVAFINTQRKAQVDLPTAVREAGVQRFRPILLTSLTTFFGLVPLMLERSMQAAFMIPMAVSLAFGVLFATVITLVLVPTGYLILDDLGRGLRWLAGRPVAADRTGLAAQAG